MITQMAYYAKTKDIFTLSSFVILIEKEFVNHGRKKDESV